MKGFNMKQFDEWFDENYPDGIFNGQFGALEKAVREVARDAWFASRWSYQDGLEAVRE